MWVDAVIFVFSLEDEISFQTVYHYYSRMANYRNTSEIPLVLVGTQGECQSYTGDFEGIWKGSEAGNGVGGWGMVRLFLIGSMEKSVNLRQKPAPPPTAAQGL